MQVCDDFPVRLIASCIGMLLVIYLPAASAVEVEVGQGATTVPVLPDSVQARQSAIKLGLNWLSSHRADAAKNKAPAPAAIAALAGMAYLESGSRPDEGDYATDLRACLDSVLQNADQSGLLGGSANSVMYNHGICTRFLAMAYAVTHDAKINDALALAVALTVKSQNDEGGWRYLPTAKDSDVSVTSCEVGGLRAAAQVGMTVPQRVFDRAADYILKCQNKDNGFRYVVGVAGSAPARSAAAVAALIDARSAGTQPQIDRGLKYLSEAFAGEQANTAFYFYGVSYASMALFNAGGDHATSEYPALCAALVSKQGRDGAWKGEFDDMFATACALNALQAQQASNIFLNRR